MDSFGTVVDMNESDSERLRLAADGVPSAIEELWQAHRDRLKRTVEIRLDPRLKRRLDASDVVQEVLLEANRRLPGYVVDRPLPFFAWLRQITMERIAKLHRRHLQAKKRRIDLEVEAMAAATSKLLCELFVARGLSPSGQVRQKEQQRRIQYALQLLKEIDREVLTLRHLEQLSIREIAAILKLTEGAVKSRHFRALGRLQDYLEQDRSDT